MKKAIFFAMLILAASVRAESLQEKLYRAAGAGNEVVRKALKEGADVNSKDKGGQTALMKAAEFGYAQVVQLLKAAGAKE